jgi:hypothetical protein
VPVVTDLPGVRDLAGDTGIVVPLRDSAALRAAFESLAGDRTRLRVLSRRARRRAEGLDWDSCVERYEHVFAKAVAERGGAPRAAVTPIRGPFAGRPFAGTSAAAGAQPTVASYR